MTFSLTQPFHVWAPFCERVDLVIVNDRSEVLARYEMEKREKGHFHHELPSKETPPGTLYFFELDQALLRPDPASKSQPLGVHGPSEVVLTDFLWDDFQWSPPEIHDYVIYELHVGTFTSEGTFSGIIPHLRELRDLGITALEIMPVAQFPGRRNWGYDGVYPYAVQNTYGGIRGLQELVNACHRENLAVILDVVYNHLGPEGNYLSDFGPYFTDKYRTPWGKAVNFDGPQCDEVRSYFIGNALYWLQEFHVDALRLDAVHAIFDQSALPFLEELNKTVQALAKRLDKKIHLIAESDLNDPRIIHTSNKGGMGFSAQWSDDFHHSLHSLLTRETSGYYEDFGSPQHLAKAMQESFVYKGQYSVHRQKKFGRSVRKIPVDRFVVCIQNHDQIGNRMEGERLSQLLTFPQLKLAAGFLLLSPYVPLIFMGEEYGERRPFQYFVDHQDPEILRLTREGRNREFSSFRWKGTPPDPGADATFQRCILDHSLKEKGSHQVLRSFYRSLLHWRKILKEKGLFERSLIRCYAQERDNIIWVEYGLKSVHPTLLIWNFCQEFRSLSFPLYPGPWNKLLDSSDQEWLENVGNDSTLPSPLVDTENGPLDIGINAESFVLYSHINSK